MLICLQRHENTTPEFYEMKDSVKLEQRKLTISFCLRTLLEFKQKDIGNYNKTVLKIV